MVVRTKEGGAKIRNQERQARRKVVLVVVVVVVLLLLPGGRVAGRDAVTTTRTLTDCHPPHLPLHPVVHFVAF